MGITWDAFSMWAAIDHNDIHVTSLLLQGGMDQKLAWTEQAFLASNTEVLGLLPRYPSQTDESKPCRQFMITPSHVMSNRASLTSLRKSYLQSFYSVPAIVARQQCNLEQAGLCVRAQPSPENEEWQEIHAGLYDTIN